MVDESTDIAERNVTVWVSIDIGLVTVRQGLAGAKQMVDQEHEVADFDQIPVVAVDIADPPDTLTAFR
jgi:hypothetical protein